MVRPRFGVRGRRRPGRTEVVGGFDAKRRGAGDRVARSGNGQDGFHADDLARPVEIVRRSPVVVVDAAHNPAGMAATARAVTESFGAAEVIAVLGVSADKDIAGILNELEPLAAAVVLTANSSPRSMPAADLAALAMPVFGPDRVHVAERLDDAIEIAVGLADEASAEIAGPLAGLLTDASDATEATTGTLVLIAGSVITAGDAKMLLSGGSR